MASSHILAVVWKMTLLQWPNGCSKSLQAVISLTLMLCTLTIKYISTALSMALSRLPSWQSHCLAVSPLEVAEFVANLRHFWDYWLKSSFHCVSFSYLLLYRMIAPFLSTSLTISFIFLRQSQAGSIKWGRIFKILLQHPAALAIWWNSMLIPQIVMSRSEPL